MLIQLKCNECKSWGFVDDYFCICNSTMSASRYIIRSEGNFDIKDLECHDVKIERETIKNKIFDVILDKDLKFSRFLEKFGKIEIGSKHPHKFVDMIHELIPYANILNYESFIIILCEKAEEIESIGGSVTWKCDSVKNINEKTIQNGSYYINIYDRTRFPYDIVIRQPTLKSLICDFDGDYEYIHPQCALLFDKNNNCRKIDLSNDTLKLISEHSLRIYDDYSMFPVGYYVWKADFLFDDTDNTLYGSKFLDSEISFFSVNKPSFDALRDGIENMFPPECEEWLKYHIKYIRKYLHLNDTHKRTKPKYEYIDNADNE